eukprot:3480774-Pleurochrysis_carterae.AAC.1
MDFFKVIRLITGTCKQNTRKGERVPWSFSLSLDAAAFKVHHSLWRKIAQYADGVSAVSTQSIS